MPLHAVLVGPHDFFFAPVEAAVRAGGHRATRYRSLDEFRDRVDALDDADVLFSVSSLPVTRERMARAKTLRAVISA